MPTAERYFLDTSAIFALTDGEEGAEVVQELLERAAADEVDVAISAVNLMELYYIAIQEQGEECR